MIFFLASLKQDETRRAPSARKDIIEEETAKTSAPTTSLPALMDSDINPMVTQALFLALIGGDVNMPTTLPPTVPSSDVSPLEEVLMGVVDVTSL